MTNVTTTLSSRTQEITPCNVEQSFDDVHVSEKASTSLPEVSLSEKPTYLLCHKGYQSMLLVSDVWKNLRVLISISDIYFNYTNREHGIRII
jgi:hypothetical protein